MEELILHVKNEETKHIFIHELQGQLSDGFWENARPLDHWKLLCSIKPKNITTSPGLLGIQNLEYQRFLLRTSYNFANPELIKAVGMRMLAIARLSRFKDVSSAERDAVTISITQDGPTAGDRKGMLVNGLQADRLFELANSESSNSEHWMNRINAIHTLYAKMGGDNVHLKLKLKAKYIVDTLNSTGYTLTDMRKDLGVLSRSMFQLHYSHPNQRRSA